MTEPTQEVQADQEVCYSPHYKTSSGNVYKKLTKARYELSKRDIKKTGRGQYNYLELSDFLPICHEIFDQLGLCAHLDFGDTCAQLIVCDVADKSYIMFSSPVVSAQLARGEPIKCLGATQTYIRRYLWLQAMEISIPDEVDASMGLKTAPVGAFSGIHNSGPGLDNLKDDLPEITIDQRVAQIEKIVLLGQLENYYKGLSVELKANGQIVEAIKKRKEELSPQGKA